MNLKKHGVIFANGVIVVAPILVTVYVLGMAMWWLDSTIRKGLDYMLGLSFPGLGLAVAVPLIYLVGLLARTWLFRTLIATGEAIVERIPLIKSLYSSVKDLLQFLGGTDAKRHGKAVALRSKDGTSRMLGIMTQEDPEAFLPDAGDSVGVYLPMSYQIGGFTVYVPRESVEDIEGVDVEDLLKLSMTAGVGVSKRPKADYDGPEQSERGGTEPS
jgi:uncharacterized membrane protein